MMEDNGVNECIISLFFKAKVSRRAIIQIYATSTTAASENTNVF